MSFSLADALKGVSNLGTGRDQIEYIRLDQIDSDENNFYQLSDLDGLANNIALCGLQQPIRVRRKDDGRYVIVSGHRRRAAVELLAKEDPEKWQEVACIIEADAVSPALQQLRLIYANANTRKLTSSEISEQAVQVEKLLYQLKEEEGYEFPGRMRDHVAQAVGVSKSKLARLKVIRDNLDECWIPYYEDNKLAEQTAYYLSQLHKFEQFLLYDYFEGVKGNAYRIDAAFVERYKERIAEVINLSCPEESSPEESCPCRNIANKRDATLRTGIYEIHSCGSCCSSCHKMTTCKYVCPKLADKVKKLKDDARAAKREEKTAQEEKERPKIQKIQELWSRFGYLRQQSGKSVQTVMDAAKMYYEKSDDKRYQDLEDGYAKVSVGTTLPYSYNCALSDVERLVALANLFGCSLDFMLCRTDVSEMATGSELTCRKEDPEELGDYLLILDQGYGSRTYEKWTWDGCVWKDCVGHHDPMIDGEIIGWIPIPKED